MAFFQHEQISTLNEKEMLVYNVVCRKMDEVPQMNIRALASAAGVSTNTVLRFCEKMGAESYTEFKYLLRKKQAGAPVHAVERQFIVPVIQYLRQAEQDSELAQKIELAAGKCTAARLVIFLGCAASGALAGYGAQLFAEAGLLTSVYSAERVSPHKRELSDVVLVVISASGETPPILSIAELFKQNRATLISITNTSTCTLARVSDINFAYYMPMAYRSAEAESERYTTQIPVCFLLEELAKQVGTTQQGEYIKGC